MPAVVGLVGRPEHTSLLVEDAWSVPVAPHVGLLEHVDDVVEPAQHVERWIVIRFVVERAAVAPGRVVLGRLEPASRLDLAHVAHDSNAAEAMPSAPLTGATASIRYFRALPPRRGSARSASPVAVKFGWRK